MKLPPIVSPQEWEAAHQELLVEEKKMTRARDALAARRRRMPWMAVDKDYRFEGPSGAASLADLFEGRHQLIVYRAFYAPDVTTYPEGGGSYPERACAGCSFLADQVAHPAHLNARDTTLAFVSRAPQAEIRGLKERMGWDVIPWYTLTDDFDADFGVDQWHGTNAFIREDGRIYRTYFVARPRRRAARQHLELPRHHRARTPGGVGGLPRWLPTDASLPVVELPRRLQQRCVIALIGEHSRQCTTATSVPRGAVHRTPVACRVRVWSDGVPAGRAVRWDRCSRSGRGAVR